MAYLYYCRKQTHERGLSEQSCRCTPSPTLEGFENEHRKVDTQLGAHTLKPHSAKTQSSSCIGSCIGRHWKWGVRTKKIKIDYDSAVATRQHDSPLSGAALYKARAKTHMYSHNCRNMAAIRCCPFVWPICFSDLQSDYMI